MFLRTLIANGSHCGLRNMFSMQIYDFDRDYKDIGAARFTIKYCVIKNCLPNAKSDTLLAAWNPPSEWGKYVILCAYPKFIQNRKICLYVYRP